jgi:hypothetical protein
MRHKGIQHPVDGHDLLRQVEEEERSYLPIDRAALMARDVTAAYEYFADVLLAVCSECWHRLTRGRRPLSRADGDGDYREGPSDRRPEISHRE